MHSLHPALEMALRKDDFLDLNQLLQIPSIRDTAHEADNYALETVIKKGILSSVRELLKINAVWSSFDEKRMSYLAYEFSNHKGIQRLVENTIFERFEYQLTNAVDAIDRTMVLNTFYDSQVLTSQLANNYFLKLAIMQGSRSLVKGFLEHEAIYMNCGLNELFLAMKYSNDTTIIRQLLNITEVSDMVGDELKFIEASLEDGDFDEVVNELWCFDNITDKSALDTTEIIAEEESSEEEKAECSSEEESSEEEEEKCSSEEESSEEEEEKCSSEEESSEEEEEECSNEEELSETETETYDVDDIAFDEIDYEQTEREEKNFVTALMRASLFSPVAKDKATPVKTEPTEESQEQRSIFEM